MGCIIYDRSLRLFCTGTICLYFCLRTLRSTSTQIQVAGRSIPGYPPLCAVLKSPSFTIEAVNGKSTHQIKPCFQKTTLVKFNLFQGIIVSYSKKLTMAESNLNPLHSSRAGSDGSTSASSSAGPGFDPR